MMVQNNIQIVIELEPADITRKEFSEGMGKAIKEQCKKWGLPIEAITFHYDGEFDHRMEVTK